jgi:hypothetical protein
VIEFSGDVVDELRASVDVGRICEAVREATDRYPVLAGVDEYDDTIFNGRQLGALIAELNTWLRQPMTRYCWQRSRKL